MQGEIHLEQLTKQFGDVVAVDGINLDMPGGEFFTMVGPSGCGKTTTLRMIAGFERPTSGRIVLDETDMAQVPPHKRRVNTVFQSYALFPHLNVADNVGFGLKYKKVTKGEHLKRVAQALDLVQLADYGKPDYYRERQVARRTKRYRAPEPAPRPSSSGGSRRRPPGRRRRRRSSAFSFWVAAPRSGWKAGGLPRSARRWSMPFMAC